MLAYGAAGQPQPAGDRGADGVFSLARDFPDQWYDLNNPSDPSTRSVTITLRDIDDVVLVISWTGQAPTWS